MSQESSATELEVAMLYSEVLAHSEDEDDVWLRGLHEGGPRKVSQMNFLFP